MDLKGKNIVIVGLGRTGLAAARFLHERGTRLLVTDKAGEKELGDAVGVLRRLGIRMEIGSHSAASFQNADLIIISPGVAHTIEPVAQANARGVPVIGEVELASAFIKEPIIAVTGTNGKTTTTALLGQMLNNSGIRAFVGGNIGNPLIEYVGEKQKAQIVVAEISSFQLDTIAAFRPKVSVLLNITPDHLDRYPDFEAYADSKMRIFKNQQAEDIAILNGLDRLIRAKTRNITCRRLFFPSLEAGDEGAILNGKKIILNLKGFKGIGSKIENRESKIENRQSLDLSKTQLQGRHNFENACAASLAAFAAGATLDGIQKALDHFKGLAHRLEHVATINTIRFYNDSKATNVDGVLRALECFSQPVVLLMGGRDKGGNFKVLQNSIRRSVKELIVMGEAAETIRSALGKQTLTKFASSMQEAVTRAFQDAGPQGVVLLSPGCASFDWYTNYAERGDDFRRAVQTIGEKAGEKNRD